MTDTTNYRHLTCEVGHHIRSRVLLDVCPAPVRPDGHIALPELGEDSQPCGADIWTETVEPGAIEEALVSAAQKIEADVVRTTGGYYAEGAQEAANILYRLARESSR